ncbi:MAG: 3-dehydroquinate synthase, partial [Cytophaga sp.]|nr:3-dehydroquinate synthase [Undibacterium sp.]
MGSGKTTVGRALAKQLNMRFVDTDHEIEARTGVSIPVIFEVEGEASFRQREAEVIRDLTAQEGIVLATGGGAILNPVSRRYLHERGTVIYLRAAISSILQRTRYDRNRPLLRTSDPRKKLEELEAQREPLYKEVAHLIIDTGRPNVQFLMQSILTQLQQMPGVAISKNSSVMHQQAAAQTLQVELGDRSYPIAIGHSLLASQELLGKYIQGQRVVIVTNTVVAPLYLSMLEDNLR